MLYYSITLARDEGTFFFEDNREASKVGRISLINIYAQNLFFIELKERIKI